MAERLDGVVNVEDVLNRTTEHMGEAAKALLFSRNLQGLKNIPGTEHAIHMVMPDSPILVKLVVSFPASRPSYEMLEAGVKFPVYDKEVVNRAQQKIGIPFLVEDSIDRPKNTFDIAPGPAYRYED